MDSGIVHHPQDDIKAWVADGIEWVEAFAEPSIAFAYVSNGRIVNAAVFNGWNYSNIEIHFRTDGRFRRAFLVWCHDYCFGHLAAERVEAKTPRHHKKMQKVLTHLGFTFEGTLKRYFGPEKRDDGILFRLLKNDPVTWIKRG